MTHAVSILTRSHDRVQRGLARSKGGYTQSFNPHPISRPGATLCGPLVLFRCTGFNPHPISRPGATGVGARDAEPAYRFNPHPISRPGATNCSAGAFATTETFQSSPDLTTGCNAPSTLIITASYINVSILTRSHDRVQPRSDKSPVA